MVTKIIFLGFLIFTASGLQATSVQQLKKGVASTAWISQKTLSDQISKNNTKKDLRTLYSKSWNKKGKSSKQDDF